METFENAEVVEEVTTEEVKATNETEEAAVEVLPEEQYYVEETEEEPKKDLSNAKTAGIILAVAGAGYGIGKVGEKFIVPNVKKGAKWAKSKWAEHKVKKAEKAQAKADKLAAKAKSEETTTIVTEDSKDSDVKSETK